MRKLSTHALQRKRWLKALGIARILFEEDGYHTAYLDEIEAFLRQHPVPVPDTPPALDADTAARVARLAERLGRVAGWSDDPCDPRRGTAEDLGQVYEDVRQLVATDPQAARALLAAYAPPARCDEPAARYTHASDTSAVASAKAEPSAPPSRYRIDHYPASRFWAVYEGNDLVAVTVYRKGAQEVTARLDAQERLIAALQRQRVSAPQPHP